MRPQTLSPEKLFFHSSRTSSLGSVMLWVSPSFVSSFRHDDCLNLLYQAWFLDDGVLAGTTSSLLRALTIIQDMGPSLGIFINLSKCGSDTTMFPDSMKASHSSNLDILGAPIGDYIHSACGLRP